MEPVPEKEIAEAKKKAEKGDAPAKSKKPNAKKK
jgi:hypothetical protein